MVGEEEQKLGREGRDGEQEKEGTNVAVGKERTREQVKNVVVS